ncbi:hypothetical protein TL16_g10445 [Triparma laevis f. inornata]|uniref:Uncharacterized protein n=1 Tax=Triparma laevis f. inornata TaxID=1714386 RepID=A0A9W7BG15_9STRA|nr:hypothetical protein TL16_g10445 [Triparma laevis f. inornata]
MSMDEGSIERRKDRVWFPHKTEVWALGQVIDPGEEKDEFVVIFEGKEFKVKKSTIEEFDPSHLLDHSDVSKINNLNDGPLLSVLKHRYNTDKIYTNVANISISFNPYKWIPGLYDNPRDEMYRVEKVPHVFSVASVVYDLLMEKKEDQSVIVSGESGAGKTEACKKVMTFLAETSSLKSGATTGSTTVEQKVMECNQFLEAFGNAKTVRNDNSSRFGKFIKIAYKDGMIKGATMNHYLLEKSRVVNSTAGERNYHIFYQMCAGASAEEKRKLNLGDTKEYKILNQGSMTVDNVDDAKDFEEVLDALKTVGATQDQISTMMELLAGVLHLGNIDFCVDDEENADIKPECVKGSLKNAMKLLQCDVLDSKLTTRVVKAKGRNSVYTVPLKLTEAQEARDALAKAVYDNLFGYLIFLCNSNLAADCETDNFIGILDIFGFEIFKINSFEQLCINYANEKLQSLFNHTVFETEQENYKKEGINCKYIEFQNNQPCVDLIEKKPIGILPILDEICTLNRSSDTDMSYLTQLNNAHRGKTKHFGVSRFAGNNSFIVKHFAGDVVYAVEGFIAKNSDKLLPDLENAMLTSKSPFIKKIFEDAAQMLLTGKARTMSGGGMGKQPTTIGFKFKNQLSGLYSDILSTTPHYIRCVKPNNNKSPHDFDAPMVMEQLRCNGTLEMVRIRREGYPMREEWKDLWPIVLKHKYWKEAHVDPKLPAEEGCKAVFDIALPPGYYQVANSGKVFMKHDTYTELERWRGNINATFVQTCYRRWIGRKNWKKLKRRIIMLQRAIGGFMARQKYKKEVHRIVVCQAVMRGYICKMIVVKRIKAVKVLDNRMHAFLAGKVQRAEFERSKQNILKIQSLARGKKGRAIFADRLYQKVVVEGEMKQNASATIIQQRLKKKQMGIKLEAWVQEAFSAASWGDLEPLKNLVMCNSTEWAVLKDVRADLCNVRDRMDGMKTLLHVTSINGNADAVKLLIDNGAEVNVIDSEGNTPLIRSAGCGDSHLRISKLLVENCKGNKSNMVNRINEEKFTALDMSLAEGAESDEGSVETVNLLMQYDAKSAKGASKAAVEKLLQQEEKKKEEKIEREKKIEEARLEKQRKEREADPHFQFLKMQTNTDESAASARAKEEERKKEKERKAEEQKKQVERIQKERVMKRTSQRSSIFNNSGGSLLVRDKNKKQGPNMLGRDVAEGKSDPSARRVSVKPQRRSSAKVSGSGWLGKGSGYKDMVSADSKTEEGGDGSFSSIPENIPELGDSLSGTSIRESIEGEQEGEEEEVVEVAPEDPPPPPKDPNRNEASGIKFGKAISAKKSAQYAQTLLKFSQAIQDAGTPTEKKGWYYLNATDEIEGPFQVDWMHSWLSDKALNGHTKVRCGEGLTFVDLSSLVPSWEGVTLKDPNPFDISFKGESEAVMDLLEYLEKQESEMSEE